MYQFSCFEIDTVVGKTPRGIGNSPGIDCTINKLTLTSVNVMGQCIHQAEMDEADD